jgi:hypothetical protein
MFSLYLTKMNIHIDNCDINRIPQNMLNMMDYLHSYLDNDWSIKKRKCYILRKNNSKILVSDTIQFSNSLHNENTHITHTNQKNRNVNDNDTKYILYFLHNVLNNGWTVKKTQLDEYIFIKNHEGKKEIFSNRYLNTFLKDNFNLNLIK